MITACAPIEARVAMLGHGIATMLHPPASTLESHRTRAADQITPRALFPCATRDRRFVPLPTALPELGDGVACGAAYLRAICDCLRDACLSPRGLHLALHLPSSAPMKCSDAEDMGLLVLEAAMNAVRHAFPGKRDGLLTIRLAADPNLDHAHCRISDDGIGMKGAGKAVGSGGGVALMQTLASNLKCNLLIMTSEAGTSISFRVPQSRG